jgi:lysophospholipase L1-like esterase
MNDDDDDDDGRRGRVQDGLRLLLAEVSKDEHHHADQIGLPVPSTVYRLPMSARIRANLEIDAASADHDEHDSAGEEEDEDVPLVGGLSPRRQKKARRTYRSTSLFFKASAIGVAVATTVGLLLFSSLQLRADDVEDFPENTLLPPPPANGSVSCETWYTGDSWKSWLKTQGSLPSEQRCGPRVVNPSQCQCHNPMEPWDKSSESAHWKQAFSRNKAMVKNSAQDPRNLDVVFFGDSITEHWLGTDGGEEVGQYKEVVEVYESLFRDEAAPLHALALGIGGDRTTNLLYRIMAGEMPASLNPQLFWILIGTNDFGAEHCSVEMVTAATIWITQVIRKSKADADIVLNSILPRGRRKLSRDPMMQQILAVNQRVECFANSMERVHFFNATDYFLTSDKQFLNMSLMPDELHPNKAGSEKWGRGISDFALNLIDTRPAAAPTSASHSSSDNDKLDSCQVDYLDKLPSWSEWINHQGVGSGSCKNPIQPLPKPSKKWNDAIQRNTELANEAAQESKRLDLVMYGDSITEFWRGDFLGNPEDKLQENAKVYQQLFRSNTSLVRGLNLGIAGDVCPNLLYRLQHGELPDGLNPFVFWVLIGTNDFASGCDMQLITAGILKVVERLRQARPESRVVLNSLLPRGREPLFRSRVWTALTAVNHRLECYASQHDGVSFFNATDLFVTEGGTMVNFNIMPDALHPNSQGYQSWGQEIVATTREMLQ